MKHLRANCLYLIFAFCVYSLFYFICGSVPELPHALYTENETTSGAEKSLNAWATARAYPYQTIPGNAFYQAFKATRQLKSKRSAINNSVSPWETMGPLNIGGRTLALAFDPVDPDILYAGSASGGLWRSTTAGVGVNAWEYIDTGFPVLGVSSIAIDPDDRDVIYIGTGEVYRYQESNGGEVIRTTRGSYGIGILKSEDGGLSWEMSLDWSYHLLRGIWSIRIDPDNSDIVFAATTEGIYRSLNAGADWEQVLDVIMGTDLIFHPTNSNILIAACGNFSSAGHGIYRTTTGGDTWQQITTGLPSSWSGKAQLGVCPTVPPRFYVSIGNEGSTRGLYMSLNSGYNWQLLNNSDYARYQGWFSHWILPDPNDSEKLFVGGIDIWLSTDGGEDFIEQSEWYSWGFGTPPQGGPEGTSPYYVHADQHYAIYHPTDPNVIYFATDGGVFRSTDGGDTFEGLNGGYATTQFYNGFSTSASDTKAMGGLQDNMTVIYEGSTSWRREIGGDGFWTAIHPTDSQTLYGEYYYLAMLRSRDGGDSWTGITPPEHSGDNTAFSAPYVLSPSDPTVLYGGRSRIYKSLSEGDEWFATNSGASLDGYNPALSMAISALSPDTVYASTAPIYSRGRIFRTTDGGVDWIDITGNLPDRYPSDLSVDPNNAAVVYVSFSGFGSSHLFKSTDCGEMWFDINGDLPDLPISAVTVDPLFPQVIYTGNDIGVYISPNGGATWEVFDSGMPIAMVSDLKVAQSDRQLRVATHGNAVFKRDLYDPGASGVTEYVPGIQAYPQIPICVSPNPVTRNSSCNFTLKESGPVTLRLFDASGRQVANILDSTCPSGDHTAALPVETMTQGIYFLRVTTPTGSGEARVIVIK